MNTDLQPANMPLPINIPISSLDAYIGHVNQIPMLSQAEEHDLAIRLQKFNDLDAAKSLVLPHARYVVKIAKGYLGYGLPLGDLIQEGNIGLMKAVRRFDPNLGVRLVTFAVHWIKSEMHEYILRNWRIVKVATTKAQRKLFFNLRRAKKRLGWFTQEEVNEVAKDLGVKPETVREMEMRLNSMDASIEAHLDNDDESSQYIPNHFLEDHSHNPENAIEASNWLAESSGHLYAALEQLDERTREIIQTRWLDENKLTLQELADKYQVSAERIRQLEKSALQKLKAALLDHAA